MTPELNKVYEAFNKWRGERANQRVGRIPVLLKQQVVALAKQHDPKELASCLGIQISTLKGWLIPPKEEINFVPLKFTAEQSALSAADQTALILTIELINGIKLRACLQFATTI